MALVRLKALEEPTGALSGEERLGYDVVRGAMLAPFKTLGSNAGLSADVCLAEVLKDNEEQNFRFSYRRNQRSFTRRDYRSCKSNLHCRSKLRLCCFHTRYKRSCYRGGG